MTRLRVALVVEVTIEVDDPDDEDAVDYAAYEAAREALDDNSAEWSVSATRLDPKAEFDRASRAYEADIRANRARIWGDR